MRRKHLLVLTLLLIAAMMAAMGTGALNVFSADRDAVMKIVNDGTAMISIVGDGKYVKEDSAGRLALDFTNTSSGGKGFNPKAKSDFYKVFTITNQSERPVYVWLESNGWSTEHLNNLTYRINEDFCTGTITRMDEWFYRNPEGLNLLSQPGYQFKEGKDGRNAFVYVEPGESFSVDLLVRTLSNYGNKNTNLNHTVIVKADVNKPIQPGQYHN